jgi:selenoprotein W-related protein
LTVELLKNFEADLASVRLVPSDGGRFEVSVEGELLYSKLRTGRHAEPGEIEKLVARRIKRR